MLVRKRFALRGFLGACPSVKKLCTNLQSKQMRRSKTWLRSRKDVKLNFLLYSHSRIYEKSSSKMCVSEKKVCPEGFLGSVSFGEKTVYKFAKQTNEAFKNLAALTKGCEIELPFMLSTDFFFIFSIVC